MQATGSLSIECNWDSSSISRAIGRSAKNEVLTSF
jgi:hypothetical protein